MVVENIDVVGEIHVCPLYVNVGVQEFCSSWR